LADEKKKTEKKAEDATKKPVEKTQPASKEKVGESVSEGQKVEDAVETSEKVEKKPDVEKVDKPVLETPTEEKTVEDKGKPEKEETKKQRVETVETPESKKGKTEPKEKTVETKPQKATEPKKPAKKQDEKDEDFQYIVRIANTDIEGDKTLIMGIAQIKGIGRHMAVLIADATGIDKKIKMGKLTDTQIEKIKKALEDIQNIAPGWMLNHRKDIDTGKDIHLISSDVELRLRDDVNLLKMIRSYRGIRHETGLSVRGQRTRANNRRGLALGVSKKRPGA
jgi:small subunit ribosomal protein S13